MIFPTGEQSPEDRAARDAMILAVSRSIDGVKDADLTARRLINALHFEGFKVIPLKGRTP